MKATFKTSICQTDDERAIAQSMCRQHGISGSELFRRLILVAAVNGIKSRVVDKIIALPEPHADRLTAEIRKEVEAQEAAAGKEASV